MNKANYGQLGGQPIDTDHLKFLQDANFDCFKGLAKAFGDKTILSGVVVSGANVGNGYIVFDGEVLPFIGGTLAAKVSIVQTATQMVFEDGATKDTEYTRYAICSAVGDFDFADLQQMPIFRTGDVKEKIMDNAYFISMFDVDGYGIGVEKGWRVLSKQVPATAGKVFVNIDTTVTDFNEPEKTGGAKEITLTSAQQGKLKYDVRSDDGDSSTGSYKSITKVKFGDQETGVDTLGSNTWAGEKFAPLENATNPFNNMPPFYVIVKLYKL